MYSEEHVTELIPGFALDCLDEEEILQVTKHLSACEVCRRELRSYQAVVDHIPLAVRQVDPPARVKESLMERVRSTQPPVRLDSVPRKQTLLKSLRASFSKFAPIYALVSLALVAILLVSNLLLLRQAMGTDRVVTAWQVVRLTGTESAPEANGMIVINPDGEHGTLIVDRLPALSEEYQYQLWLVDDDGTRTNGGVFSVSSDGYGSLWVGAPRHLASYPAFGITIEPAGGSEGPTGERVLGGRLDG
jgi:anti-sigma-K factor RskA